MVGKSESKALIEAYAKTSGKPAEEIAAEIAAMFGYSKSNIPLPTGEEEKLSPMMRAIIEARKTEQEMGAAGKGEVSPMIKMMMETVTMMPLMKMMGGMGQENTSSTKDEYSKFERLLEQQRIEHKAEIAELKAAQKEDALQARLDRLETLIAAGTNKKDEQNPVLEEIKETRKELQAEKEKRHEEALAAKDDKIADLKDYVDNSLTAIQNQPAPKDPTEAFLEMMQKMETFDNTVRRRGRALGLTDEQVNKEVESTKPAWQQMLADITGEKGLLSKYIGMQKGGIIEGAQPEIAQPEIAAPQIICGDCGKISDNSSDWCNACRIRYSNDAVEAQRKAAEAAQKAPPAQQTEAEARAKGEIPVEAQPEEAQQV